MNNVVLSRKMDTYLQLENWLKTEDDIVQHHLRMHTLVTQSFLLLASFASDWRSALSIDWGLQVYWKELANLQMKNLWIARRLLHFFLHSCAQQLLQISLCFLISFSFSIPSLWKYESPNALTLETHWVLILRSKFFKFSQYLGVLD